VLVAEPSLIPSGRPLRVLIVDDTAADIELSLAAFGPHESIVLVDTCASGGRALAFLRDPEIAVPDVVLLDLNMPGLSGFDVLAQMKSDPALSVIPVVVLTSSGQERDIQEAYSLHASSYLIKAMDFGQFVNQIDSFVNFWIRCRTTADERIPQHE
jgi:CheY-like chemotaxis protein